MAEHPIALSKKETIILELLLDGREMYGLEIVERSDARIRSGTVYVTTTRMEEKGLIESRLEARTEGHRGLPKRLYRITGYGERVFRAWGAYSAVVLGATR